MWVTCPACHQDLWYRSHVLEGVQRWSAGVLGVPHEAIDVMEVQPRSQQGTQFFLE